MSDLYIYMYATNRHFSFFASSFWTSPTVTFTILVDFKNILVHVLSESMISDTGHFSGTWGCSRICFCKGKSVNFKVLTVGYYKCSQFSHIWLAWLTFYVSSYVCSLMLLFICHVVPKHGSELLVCVHLKYWSMNILPFYP